MESLTAALPERLETEKKELVPEYKKNPEMEMPTAEVNGQECVISQSGRTSFTLRISIFLAGLSSSITAIFKTSPPVSHSFPDV